MWSMRQKTKNTHSVMPKLMMVCTFFESRNMYLGTLTLVKMCELDMRAVMPCEVASLK